VPPYLETRRYVPRVLEHYHRLRLAQQAPRADPPDVTHDRGRCRVNSPEKRH
jgi:hypothetical protein